MSVDFKAKFKVLRFNKEYPRYDQYRYFVVLRVNPHPHNHRGLVWVSGLHFPFIEGVGNGPTDMFILQEQFDHLPEVEIGGVFPQ